MQIAGKRRRWQQLNERSEPSKDEAVEEKSTSDVKQSGLHAVIYFTWPMYEAQTSNSSRRRVSDASTDDVASFWIVQKERIDRALNEHLC